MILLGISNTHIGSIFGFPKPILWYDIIVVSIFFADNHRTLFTGPVFISCLPLGFFTFGKSLFTYSTRRDCWIAEPEARKKLKACTGQGETVPSLVTEPATYPACWKCPGNEWHVHGIYLHKSSGKNKSTECRCAFTIITVHSAGRKSGCVGRGACCSLVPRICGISGDVQVIK